jgi:hypothetical protein
VCYSKALLKFPEINRELICEIAVIDKEYKIRVYFEILLIQDWVLRVFRKGGCGDVLN